MEQLVERRVDAMKSGNIWEEFEVPVLAAYEAVPTAAGLVVRASSTDVVRYFRPLERSGAGLFAEFAALDVGDDPAPVLAFCHQYGMLGAPVEAVFKNGVRERWPLADMRSSQLASIGLDARLGKTSHVAEALNAAGGEACWSSQVSLMRMFIEWSQHEPNGTESQTDSADLTPLTSEQVRQVRGVPLQMLVNETLAQCCGPRVTMSPDLDSWIFRFEPRSLLGAIWLQAAQAASAGLQHRQCARDGCRKLIAIARSVGARSDARFCSDACKSKDYRNRLQRAKRLRKDGWTIARIAKAVDTPQLTVKGWLR